MTPPEVLAAARELMLLQHGPDCVDRPFWEQVATSLREAEGRILAGFDPADDEQFRPIAVATTYLATTSIKETADARP